MGEYNFPARNGGYGDADPGLATLQQVLRELSVLRAIVTERFEYLDARLAAHEKRVAERCLALEERIRKF